MLSPQTLPRARARKKVCDQRGGGGVREQRRHRHGVGWENPKYKSSNDWYNSLRDGSFLWGWRVYHPANSLIEDDDRVGQGGVVECDIKRRPVDPRACGLQSTPLGPWGVGASAGPVAAGLKVVSGRVQNPTRV